MAVKEKTRFSKEKVFLADVLHDSFCITWHGEEREQQLWSTLTPVHSPTENESCLRPFISDIGRSIYATKQFFLLLVLFNINMHQYAYIVITNFTAVCMRICNKAIIFDTILCATFQRSNTLQIIIAVSMAHL